MAIVGLQGIEPGQLFTRDGNDVWRVQSTCELPTICLVNVETGQKVDAAVGSLLVKDFSPLVKQLPEGVDHCHPSGVRLD